jgi:hypothetical protein
MGAPRAIASQAPRAHLACTVGRTEGAPSGGTISVNLTLRAFRKRHTKECCGGTISVSLTLATVRQGRTSRAPRAHRRAGKGAP